jgi:hypothetical protein
LVGHYSHTIPQNNTYTCPTLITFLLTSNTSPPTSLFPPQDVWNPQPVRKAWSHPSQSVPVWSPLPNKDLQLMKVTDSFSVRLSFQLLHFPFNNRIMPFFSLYSVKIWLKSYYIQNIFSRYKRCIFVSLLLSIYMAYLNHI